jgi:ArsR family transcriptional regulator, arsenate/arsenite/antimonite-responsive transcriptional repressor
MELARALGDPLRWRIVELLAAEQLCVAHLAEELQTAQPLVSHHLKVLRAAGLIEPDRYRYWTYYRRQVPGADPTQRAAVRPAVSQGGRPIPFPDAPLDPISRQTFARSDRVTCRGVPRHLFAGDHRTLRQ